mmetsp:Transcript_21155/g.49668  ORF Transcript_21155/g.49668 Transcript_21155/m.49668 type:complete len:123 (-) Transcript_21155:211-579(-)
MVLGRAGLRLEAQKFAAYLIIPVTASLAFNEPTVQKWAADYFQFMKYPSNPKTNLKDEYETIKKEREEEKRMREKRAAGREEYLKQLKTLKKMNKIADDGAADGEENKGRWFGWLRWRRQSE